VARTHTESGAAVYSGSRGSVGGARNNGLCTSECEIVGLKMGFEGYEIRLCHRLWDCARKRNEARGSHSIRPGRARNPVQHSQSLVAPPDGSAQVAMGALIRVEAATACTPVQKELFCVVLHALIGA
jgi:hypothetical protein